MVFGHLYIPPRSFTMHWMGCPALRWPLQESGMSTIHMHLKTLKHKGQDQHDGCSTPNRTVAEEPMWDRKKWESLMSGPMWVVSALPGLLILNKMLRHWRSKIQTHCCNHHPKIPLMSYPNWSPALEQQHHSRSQNKPFCATLTYCHFKKQKNYGA